MTEDAHVHLEASLRLQERPRDGLVGGALLSELVGQLLTESARSGATRVRLRYNAVGWAVRGVDRTAQLAALRRAAEIAAVDLDVHLEVYVTIKREWSVPAWREAVDVALSGATSGIRGIDISRSYDLTDPRSVPEGIPLTTDLVTVLRGASESGLQVAAHLGWYDAADDLGALLDAGVRRIGHGTPLVDHPEWDVELAQALATIEVCPTAFTRRTGRPVHDLPVERWADAGIRVEIGTDHPVALGTDLVEETRRMTQAHSGWAPADSAPTTRTAAPG